METEESVNPYSAPQSNDEPSANSRNPSLLATLLIGVASVVAGVCTWYGTCTGFIAVGYLGPGIINGVAMLMGIVLCIPAGVFAARWTRRTLLARLVQQHESRESRDF
ncbi:MAG TPA: hypothetical protein EYG03_13275 [Planctomycetes bacterium]|nr:hypothetical protein [Fuerstiella sp.]HIK92933.1 hypothetical protein [Planctomycetota bacterium]